jgi:hypothetical protein
LASIRGRHDVWYAHAAAGRAAMTVLLWIVLLAPTVLFLVFGLMHVLLDAPRDKKALAILKLLPKSPTQVISLIVDMIRSSLQN